MKVSVIANQQRYDKFYPGTAFADSLEKVFVPLGVALDDYPEEFFDADFLGVDAIASVPAELIERMPNLRLIHSEGVAFNSIDVEAARERGIYVCNNRGINATAVAEQAILLMLGLFRKVAQGNAAVLAGEQIVMKERMMVEGYLELGDCTVGLVGFGDIAKATARLLAPFGCKVLYTATSRKAAEVEADYGVEWRELPALLSECDVVSLHVPVNPTTTNLVDRAFLEAMGGGSYLINTSRGELVDNEALAWALEEGIIAGAGLDTVAPEPVTSDNVLVNLSEAAQNKVLFSPHLGGVTTSTFRRGHANMYAAYEAVAEGKRPANVVNGL